MINAGTYDNNYGNIVADGASYTMLYAPRRIAGLAVTPDATVDDQLDDHVIFRPRPAPGMVTDAAYVQSSRYAKKGTTL